MLNALDTLIDNGLSDSMLDTVIDDLLECGEFDDDDDKLCLIGCAWSRHEGNNTGPADCSICHGGVVKIGGNEYRILTDDERETAFEDALENTLDECVEGSDGPYFDRDGWKRDARIDGAGHYLSGYDGEENEFEACGEYWFIYRVA